MNSSAIRTDSRTVADEAIVVEGLYRRLWGALHRPDDGDLTQHELELLHHIPAEGSVDLGTVAQHLGLPKSTASVVVKSLGARGFVQRARDTTDERRLALSLTAAGRSRVDNDTVLDVDRLARALGALRPDERGSLITLLGTLAANAERAKQQTDDRSEQPANKEQMV